MITIDPNSAHKVWQSLADIAELLTVTATNRADFIQECRSGKFDGVMAIYRTLPSVTITGNVDEEILNALPSSLRFISHCGIPRPYPAGNPTPNDNS